MGIRDYQPHIYQTFQNIITQDKLSHAYLFSGAFGTFDMAMLLAKTIFCQSREQSMACGNCRTCRLIDAGEFPDVKVIEPTATVIKTDMIRQLMGEVSQSGFEGEAQVFIIKDSDKLHINAANSLLKMIEEPISESYIFLLTRDEDKVLPTIRSRCQTVFFPPNKGYLIQVLEAEGLLQSQAKLLSELVTDIDTAKKLANSERIWDKVKVCERFLDQWLKKSPNLYLEVSRLTSLVVDKGEQEQLVAILIALLGQHLHAQSFSTYLEHLEKVRQMLKANVSLQNALEYMVLVTSKG